MAPLAVDPDMAMADDLARGERRRREFQTIDGGIEPAFQQIDQIFRGVAAAAHGLVIQLVELAFADIAVIALQLLLGHQLRAVIGRLLAALAVLARAIFAAIDRALGLAPEIDAEAAVDFMLGL